MKENYWILRLKTLRLLKILMKARTGEVGKLTYIEATKPAARLLKLFQAWFLRLELPFPGIEKIKPRESVAGPVLNLSSVRNDNGEVISLDLYRRLLDVRRGILERFLEDNKDLSYFSTRRHLDAVSGNIAMQIAIDVRAVVYLAYYGKWKYHGENREQPGQKIENVLILPGSQWSRYLEEYFLNRQVVHRVEVESGEPQLFRRFGKYVNLGLRAASKIGIIESLRQLRKRTPLTGSETDGSIPPQPEPNTGSRILVTYAMGLLENRRNDISFFHAAKINPNRLLVYFKIDKFSPTQQELEWLRKNNIAAIAAPTLQNDIPGVPVWNPSDSLENEMKRFCRSYMATLGECLRKKKKHGPWFLERLWNYGREVTYWKDFFHRNNVKIYVNPNPNETNFAPDLAIAEVGGIAVEAERSIRFDYCTYIHNPPTTVNFVTGPYSVNQIPEPAFGRFTVQTGALNVVDGYTADPEVEEKKKMSRLVVTIFDESANDVFFGESIRQLYRSVLTMAEQQERLVFYIKTKKRDILENMRDIDEAVEALRQRGAGIIGHHMVSAAAAASFSDLVISVPSTAAFESVMVGTPTIVFNPMRAGSLLFYTGNGLNKRVFEDPEALINAVHRWAQGSDPTLGDCSDIREQIDPYGDKRGAERIGRYMERVLEQFDQGIPAEENIRLVNRDYMDQWGTERVTDANSFERLSAPRYYRQEKKN
jgi:hypothetical protein